MITTEKTYVESFAYLVVLIMLLVVIGGYSKQLIEWMFTRFYEFFIQKHI